MVEKAFIMLDKNNSGSITIEDIISIYDVSMNPEFIEGRKTKE
jgi:Ca2+-binding EF-hand superfamily protein